MNIRGETAVIKATVVDMALPETGRMFAVSDIHGAGDLLKRALEQVGFGPEDTLFVLGDIVEKRAGSLRIGSEISLASDYRFSSKSVFKKYTEILSLFPTTI